MQILIIIQILVYVHINYVLLLELTPIVKTKNGAVVGEFISDGQYNAYRAIPYAEPPVGELRFEPPVALSQNWSSTLMATRFAPKCLQWSGLKMETTTEQSEDCLYLNIFVPRCKEEQENRELLPVIVFIHGGGFMWGSADFYGEQNIMAHGKIILVTLNYRLGPFGFLSTENDDIAGNMGLKDQSLALKWIHENIVYFNGDANKVLLAGWSAGGSSVNYHMIAEMTQNKWFQSAASLSGAALCACHSIYAGAALKKAQTMAKYLNCSVESLATTKGIKLCLKAQTANDIVEQIPKFFVFSNNPFSVFGPVIEHGTGNERFLNDHVENLMRAGKTKVKPWLITRTDDDGAFGTAEFLKRNSQGIELIQTLNERWLEWAPIMLFFNATLSTEEQRNLAAQLREKYFGKSPISLETYDNLERLYNFELSTKCVNQLMEIYVNYTSDALAYGYVYDNPAPYGFGQILSERDDWKFGTLHGDDINLIFNTSIRQQYPLSAAEKLISNNFIGMLVSLAETGIPTYAGTEFRKISSTNKFSFNRITKEGIH